MDKKYKSLLDNTAIFGIGNIVSKLSQYLIIALCTYKLTTAEFGISEIIIQTVTMLVPVFSADIAEGLFRFSMDKNYSKEQIVSNAMLINCVGCIIALIAFPIEYFFLKSIKISLFITILTLIEIFQVSIKEFIRGLGLIKIYMISGFINAAIQVSCCVLYVYVLNLGITGYILTLITAYIFEIIYCFFRINVFQFLQKSSFSKTVLKDLLKYSIPLAPNKIMWWIISAFNRYFLLWLVNASATGLYSVAAKFPALITIVVSFFFKAWQISALEEFDSKERDKFYSKVFNLLWSTIGILTAVALLIIRFAVKLLVSDAFFSSWEYAPFLLVAAAFSAIQSFLGVNYTLQKDSVGALCSTTVAAVSNLVLNYILITTLGIQGASVATFISYLIVAVYRFFDTKKYVALIFDSFNCFVITYGILIFECVVLSLNSNLYFITLPGLLAVLLVNLNTCKQGFRFINIYIRGLKSQ